MIQNRTIFTADNLPVMRGMESNSIDLIYLDPPFNSNRTYAAPIGSEAAGAFFNDIWTLSDADNVWHGEISDKYPELYEAIRASEHTYGPSMKSYLIAMGVRLIEMKRILKPTGSIYYHCDPTASHYVKAMMDSIMGSSNFRNEIVWHYTGGGRSKAYFSKKHDIIFWYSASQGRNYCFNIDEIRVPYKANGGYAKEGIVAKSGKRYMPNPKGTPVEDVWYIPIINPMAKERTGYPTQKPLKLLARIIKASSNAGDMVLDPFCGCATTCISAESFNRQWIGIDIAPKAIDLVKLRLKKELNLDETDGLFGSVTHRTDIPKPVSDGVILQRGSPENVPSRNVVDPIEREFQNNKDLWKYEMYGEQDGKCNGCKNCLHIRNLVIDHIVPKNPRDKSSPRGTSERSNLQLLCGSCNSIKGNRDHSFLLYVLKRMDGGLKLDDMLYKGFQEMEARNA